MYRRYNLQEMIDNFGGTIVQIPVHFLESENKIAFSGRSSSIRFDNLKPNKINAYEFPINLHNHLNYLNIGIGIKAVPGEVVAADLSNQSLSDQATKFSGLLLDDHTFSCGIQVWEDKVMISSQKSFYLVYDLSKNLSHFTDLIKTDKRSPLTMEFQEYYQPEIGNVNAGLPFINMFVNGHTYQDMNLLSFIPNVQNEAQEKYIEFITNFANNGKSAIQTANCSECKGKGYVDLFQFRYNCSRCGDGQKI